MTTFAKLLLGAALTVGTATIALAKNDSCNYQGTVYSHGAAVCQAGTQFRCDDGDWKSLAVACSSPEGKACDFNGSTYESGSTSCQGGTQYRCDSGLWKNIGGLCSPDQIAAPRVINPGGRTCMLDGSTVSSKSTVCKSGVMYACDDGDWRNLGMPCR
jgi:hypothetical protein